MATTLLDIVPQPSDLLALEPEDLAAILIEVIPGISQSAGFSFNDLERQLHPIPGGGYPHDASGMVTLALEEALSWLITQGLVVQNREQPNALWFRLSRRGRSLKTRANVEAYRLGRSLPMELLAPVLADKVRPLFLRGDHETAVFQAFKEVEVAVRTAGGYADDVIGRDLMQRAFQPKTGPLTDKASVKGEQESMMFLFSGAIGHAKNPPSHRNVSMHRLDAARLIVFASHLLELVALRVILG